MIKNLGFYSVILLLINLFVLSSCSTDKEKKKEVESLTLFTKLTHQQTGIDFSNIIENDDEMNILKYRNFYNGGGVAIGDINNDGLADIFLTSNSGSNKLYLNNGDFSFEDITNTAKISGNKPWSTGVNMVDINDDGLLDIYISHAGNLEGKNHFNELYINNGDLTFTEKAEIYNLADTGFSIHSTFFDFDQDGDLDVYIINNSNIPVNSLGYAQQRDKRAENWKNVPKIFRGKGDLLMRNDGEIFTDVSEAAGIYGSLIGFGLGVIVTDINNDKFPDLYVTNDFYERDYLYINNQDGTFKEDIKNWTSHLSLSAMGVDIADINNDGLQDIIVTDMLPDNEKRVKSVMEFDNYDIFKRKEKNDFHKQFIQNTLQLNNGNNSFSEIAYYSGIYATDWSWSPLLFDMDNDGYRDLYITNGINHDLTDLDFVDFMANDILKKMIISGQKEALDSVINKMPKKPLANYAFHNNKDLTFTNKALEWGLGTISTSNGAAYGDLDNDGDLDLVVNNVNMESFVYRNNAQQLNNNYLKINFEGKQSNRFGVGASVRLWYDGESYLQELQPSRGFQSSMDYGMTIGLGKSSSIDSLRVVWPNSATQLLTKLPVNQTLTLKQAEAAEIHENPNSRKTQTLIKQLPNKRLFAHEENSYNDFNYEGLISKKLSEEGPALAVGDIDGDGNEDIFIGGAKDQTGTLYIHKGKGNLIPSKKVSFSKATIFEDTAASFVDVNNDNLLDLVVATGGNQVGGNSFYRPRLYINEGQGFFKEAILLPSVNQSMSVIAPYDYDQDGDIDLFIGSRSVTGIYGINPTHLFLKNDGKGNFTKDIIRSKSIESAGMITDAIWVDMNSDGIKDLLTTADWGPISCYINDSKKITEISNNLSQTSGWWNTIEAADLDNDGDLDLIIGNDGTNLHYKPKPNAPLRMYINDFDSNGTVEQITTFHENGKDYPIHQKKELTSQLSSLKKENLKASDYAKRSIDELFTPEIIEKSTIKEVRQSESVIAINEGDGKFTIKPLPFRVQLSCVCGIACTDINNDGHLDILMGGNNFEFKPQYSQLDASYGNVLLGDGKNNFEWQDYTDSGFYVREEMKHLASFKDNKGNIYFIAALNNSKPKIFTLNN